MSPNRVFSSVHTRARAALAALVRRAGVRGTFAVSVSEPADTNDYEVIVVDLDQARTRLYRGGDRWATQFWKDIARGLWGRSTGTRNSHAASDNHTRSTR